MISVALTTYNGEKFLREQLDSIYAQSYKNIEVIVCDDCSSDSTVGILEEYRSKFGLKYYINEKNLGFVKNFEKAISLCTGDFIALSDQDDIWVVAKLETLINQIGESDLIFADAVMIDDDEEIITDSFMKANLLYYSKSDQFERLLYRNFVQGASMLFRTELRERILPFPEEIPYHDWWIALTAASGSEIKYEEKALIKYRIHVSNNSGASNFAELNFLGKLTYYETNDNKLNAGYKNSFSMIQFAKEKFKDENYIPLFNKAEEYFKIHLNSKGSCFFKVKRFFYITVFSLKNKYIFRPNSEIISYIKELLTLFLVPNSRIRKIIRKFVNARVNSNK